MATRSFYAIDSESLTVTFSTTQTVGDSIINNSDSPNGTQYVFGAGYSTAQITVDDTGGSVDTLEDDAQATHVITDGAGLVANGNGVEAESIIQLQELDAFGAPTGPVITLVVFSQNGTTGDVWGYASDTPLVPGVEYEKVGGGNIGAADYADYATSWMTSVDGTAGADSMGSGYADAQGDLIDGADGDDEYIFGNGGADSIDGGVGDDVIDGGADADTFFQSDNFGSDTIIGGETGTDNDVVDFSNVSGAVSVLLSSTEDGTATMGANSLDFSQIEGFVLSNQNDIFDGRAATAGLSVDAGDGADRVIGGTGADTLTGGAGNDRLVGGTGADVLDGGTGADTLNGNGGTDSITGGDGADVLNGGGGSDTLDGGAGADALNGGGGSDVLVGGAGSDTLNGGNGNDSLTGGDGDDVFTISAGNDTISDFNVGNTGTSGDGDASNNDFIDLGGYYDSLDELRADHADDGILNQSNLLDDEGNAVDYSDNTLFGANSITLQSVTADSFFYDNTGIVCFTQGTLIQTPRGSLPIESLRPGDLVSTLDNGPQPIAWIGARRVDTDELVADRSLRPVLIPGGVLGAERDLCVSRQHGMMVGPDHLVRAIHLARDMPGVRIAHGKRRVCYIHLLFDAHQIVLAEGIPSESFYPGPNALQMLTPQARESLLGVLPGLATRDAFTDRAVVEAVYGPPARPFAALKDLPADPLPVLRAA
ncbi:Hint domain-containing protein [Roseivivax sp. CAU 1753]